MDAPFTIFIVGDDPWYGQLLHHFTFNSTDTVHLWTSDQDCLNNMHLQPDVVTSVTKWVTRREYEIYGSVRTRGPAQTRGAG